MNLKQRIHRWQLAGLCLTMIIGLFGCAGAPADQEQSSSEQRRQTAADSLEALKQQRRSEDETQKESHIRIDPLGYGSRDVKTAYFFGNDLQDVFWVIDAKDRSRVFEGRLQQIPRKGDQTLVLRGDFSALTQPGEYYIQTAVIGQSPVFTIRQEGMQLIETQMLTAWDERSAGFAEQTQQEQFCDNAAGLMALSAACELYFPADSMAYQSLAAGAGALLQAGRSIIESGRITQRQTAYFCSAMAMTAYVLGEDSAAEPLRQGALAAYEQIPASGTDEADTEAVLCARAALYRLTQDRRYADALEGYLADVTIYTPQNFYIVYCYLTTRKNVDIDLCNDLMKTLIETCTDRSQQITAEGMLFLPDGPAGNDGRTSAGRASDEQADARRQALFSATLLSLADHVLVSREYRRSVSQICHELSMGGLLDPTDMNAEELAQAYKMAAAQAAEED